MSAILELQNDQGQPLPPLTVPALTSGIVDLGAVRVANVGDSAPTVTRVTFSNIDWSWSGGDNSQGQECLSEKWLEAREGAGAWTPIGGLFTTAGNYLEISNPAAGSYTEIELRLNVPAGAETAGSFSGIPIVAWSED